jgi:hypothetical protein
MGSVSHGRRMPRFSFTPSIRSLSCWSKEMRSGLGHGVKLASFLWSWRLSLSGGWNDDLQSKCGVWDEGV